MIVRMKTNMTEEEKILKVIKYLMNGAKIEYSGAFYCMDENYKLGVAI